jgi:pimeloyl-ACP methyl ester carboxylesterase
MWSALIRQLSASHRVLAPDLIGYGQSGLWPEGRPYEADADARVLAALARKAGSPVHFVGHSYGAAMALEAARMLGGAVRGMTLIEPVSFHLLRAAGRDDAYHEVEAVAHGTIAAVAEGDRRRASAVYMGFWLGRLRWWLAPKKLKDPVMDTVDKVALEFGAIEQQEVESLAPYQALRVPTLLLYGAKTRLPAKVVVEVLDETLPLSRAAAIPGAGHMSPFTHRDAVNAVIAEHIEEVDRAAA